MQEGSVLLSAKGGSEYRYLFMFSDLLLVTKQRKNKYRVKHPMPLLNVTVLSIPETEGKKQNRQNPSIDGNQFH